LAIANWQLFEQQNVVGRKKKFPFQKPACHAIATLHVGPWYVNRIYPDAAMGIAYASTLEEGETLATLELKINFLKPIWQAKLRAIGKVVHQGHTVGLVECNILDEQDYLIARASCTCMTLRATGVQGR
jgi:uncharacterized protein (TIGR00369 family)